MTVLRLRREDRKKPTQAVSRVHPTEGGSVACPVRGQESAVCPLGRPALLGPSVHKRQDGGDLGADWNDGGAAHRREPEKRSLWNHHRCPWEAPKLGGPWARGQVATQQGQQGLGDQAHLQAVQWGDLSQEAGDLRAGRGAAPVWNGAFGVGPADSAVSPAATRCPLTITKLL